MDVDGDRTLVAIGITEHVGDDAVSPLGFFWVKAEECAFDAKDGDLLTQPLPERKLGAYLYYSIA